MEAEPQGGQRRAGSKGREAHFRGEMERETQGEREKIERVKETKAEVNRDRGKGGPSQRGERSSLNKANQSEQVG